MGALNAQKNLLLDSEVTYNKVALDTQVEDTGKTGLSILDIMGALNAQKNLLLDSEVTYNKVALDTQVEDTEKTGLSILDIMGALNAQKEFLNQSYLGTEKINYTEHFDFLKEASLDWLNYSARHEGFQGVLIKARLDNTLEDYRDFYQSLKDEADSAYQYIQERMVSPGTRSEKSGSFSSPRLAGLSRQRQLQQKDRETVLQIKWDDGTTKKVQAQQVQLESDRRVFQ